MIWLNFKFLKKHEIVAFLRHFKDNKDKRNIIVSISYIDCNTKIWEFKN